MAAPKRSFLHDDGRGSNDGCWQTAVIEISDEDAQGGGARTWTCVHVSRARSQRISADLVSAARPAPAGAGSKQPRERRASRGRGAPLRARPKRTHACDRRAHTRSPRADTRHVHPVRLALSPIFIYFVICIDFAYCNPLNGMPSPCGENECACRGPAASAALRARHAPFVQTSVAQCTLHGRCAVRASGETGMLHTGKRRATRPRRHATRDPTGHRHRRSHRYHKGGASPDQLPWFYL